MSFYPKKIQSRFAHPKNAGEAKGANAIGTSATFVCGAVLRLFLRIDAESKEILQANFKSNACGYAVAAAEVLAEKIIGKRLIELHGADRDIFETEIEASLGELPAPRKHCLSLAAEGFKNALADFRVRQIEEFAGEKVLICTCFGVSEDAIENLIKENSLETVEGVTDVCNAGGGCGSCQPLIQDILDVYRREQF